MDSPAINAYEIKQNNIYLRSEIQLLRRKNSFLNERFNEQLKQTEEKLRSELDRKEELILKLQKKLESSNNVCQKLNYELNELQKEKSKTSEDFKRLSDNMEKSKDTIKKLESELITAKAKCIIKDEMLSEMQQKLKETSDQLEDTRKNQEKIEKEKEKIISSLQTQLRESTRENSSLKHDFEHANLEKVALRKKCQEQDLLMQKQSALIQEAEEIILAQQELLLQKEKIEKEHLKKIRDLEKLYEDQKEIALQKEKIFPTTNQADISPGKSQQTENGSTTNQNKEVSSHSFQQDATTDVPLTEKALSDINKNRFQADAVGHRAAQDQQRRVQPFPKRFKNAGNTENQLTLFYQLSEQSEQSTTKCQNCGIFYFNNSDNRIEHICPRGADHSATIPDGLDRMLGSSNDSEMEIEM